MNDQAKTNAKLLKEISVLTKKIKKLEKAETAAKRVEEVLQESEERYRALLEIFYTLKEAKTLIEKWRMEYNTFRPHSSLNYRPPAPEAYLN